MMDNNMYNTDVKKTKNRGGSFYLLMGILTLVMAIAGSTYAYFAVSATSNGNEITGTSAYGDTALTIEISQISTGTGKLVPQLGSAIQKAYTGTGGKTCVDGNGNTICKAYSIKITNNSDVKLNVDGKLTLTATDMNNLKWAIGTNASTYPTATASQHPKSYTTLGNTALEAKTNTAGNNHTFYVIIWIEEQNASQQDKNEFTGVVNFDGYITGGDGTRVNGITSTIRG